MLAPYFHSLPAAARELLRILSILLTLAAFGLAAAAQSGVIDAASLGGPLGVLFFILGVLASGAVFAGAFVWLMKFDSVLVYAPIFALCVASGFLASVFSQLFIVGPECLGQATWLGGWLRLHSIAMGVFCCVTLLLTVDFAGRFRKRQPTIEIPLPPTPLQPYQHLQPPRWRRVLHDGTMFPPEMIASAMTFAYIPCMLVLRLPSSTC